MLSVELFLPPLRLLDHGSCIDGWISSVALWQEVLGKDVFNAEVKEAVAEVLFHPRHHLHFLPPGLLLPGRHLHQGGGKNDCGAHLGSGFQSARPMFHKWLDERCVSKCYNREAGMVGGGSSLQRKNPRAGINIVFTFSFCPPIQRRTSNYPKKTSKVFFKTCSLHTSFYFAPEDGDQTARLKTGFF